MPDNAPKERTEVPAESARTIPQPPAGQTTVVSGFPASADPALPRISNYELLRRIGHGAYGEVWLARSVVGAFHAVKVVYRKSFETDRPYEREFAGIQKFEPISRSHPGLVNILHVGRDDEAGYFYYVMELADDEGGNPKSEIRNPKEIRSPKPEAGTVAAPALRNSDFGFLSDFGPRNSDFYTPRTLHSDLKHRGRLTPDDCVQIGLALTRALGYLHEQGLVHRDIKPANIIFVKGAPKLADIGLVCGTEGTVSYVGTEGYIPPEGPGTPQADLYSLGKVFYEMSTGKDRTAFPDLPTDLRVESEERKALLEWNEVLVKACAGDVRQRYQTAHEMEAELALLREGKSIKQMRTARHRRNRIRLALTLVAIALGGLGLWQSGSWTALKSSKPVPQAYELYLQAKDLASRSSGHQESPTNNVRVIHLLEESTRLDPKFAEAHAQLALAYVIRFFLFQPDEKELEAKVEQELRAAFHWKPNCAEAFFARGRFSWTPLQHFPHEKAIQDFKRALLLDPSLDDAHHYLGLVYLHVGLLDEARREFMEAIQLNPANNGAQYRIGETLLSGRQYADALRQLETIDRSFNPDLHASQKALAFFGLDEKKEALDELEKRLRADPQDGGGLLASVQAMIYASSGRVGEAEERIASAKEKRGFGHFHHTEYNLACANALMNRTNEAIKWFGSAVNDGLNCYPLFERDRNLDSIRSVPRFQELLALEGKKHARFKAEYSKGKLSPSSN